MAGRNLIFVVDDDPGTLRGVKRLLREYGYDSVLFPSVDAVENHGACAEVRLLCRIRHPALGGERRVEQ